VLLLYCSAGTW